MRRNSAATDAAMPASIMIYAYGSTPIPNHSAGAAVVGYTGPADPLVELARPVNASSKVMADLFAVLMAIDLVLRSGVHAARIAFWSPQPIEELLNGRSHGERDDRLNPNLHPTTRQIIDAILDKLELARRTRTTITFENRNGWLQAPEEKLLGSMKFRTKKLALHAARVGQAAPPAPVAPGEPARAVAVDRLGLSARKWSSLVENLVEVGAVKSSPRDRMIAELSIRRAMDAFHRTLEHVCAA